MIHTISNSRLSVLIDSLGAQLRSVRSTGGTEYLWQGDGRYWPDSSPLLFPYIARLYDGAYTYMGRRYGMGIHGFASHSEFSVESSGPDRLCLALCENEATLNQYPFPFRLSVCYSLDASRLRVRYRVENRGCEIMPFAIGGHPGINVPLWPGTEFEDYFLEFAEVCAPLRIGFTDKLFLSGEDSPYQLEDGRILRLRHSLFDEDAIVLKNTAKHVSLRCTETDRSITMDFHDFAYFGLWHAPGTDAPYVCLEPWTSLPSRQGIIEELSEKADMLFLSPGEAQEKEWSLSILEE